MSESAVAGVFWASGFSEDERPGARALSPSARDPFDWSRRQVALHHRAVYRLALAILGPGGEAEAEEVAQEAFLRLHAGRHRFRGDSSVATWLHRVAFRLAVDLRRRPRRTRPHVGIESLEHRHDRSLGEPFEQARRSERSEAVRRCIGQLSETQQAVIRLHYWLDASVVEIGEALDLPPGTVKSHLHRARAALAALLERAPG